MTTGPETADEQGLAEACAAALYEADPSSRHLGIEVAEVGPGRAEVTMTATAAMANGHGTVHGGYLFLLADTAFAFACNSRNQVTVARGADICFVQPGRVGDRLVAAATERLSYGRNGVFDVTVRRTDGEVVAEFRGTSRGLGTAILPARDDDAHPGGGGTVASGPETSGQPAVGRGQPTTGPE